MSGSDAARRYDLDWLRIFVTLAVLVFHSARFFNHMDWHVKNPQLSTAMDVLVGLLSLWIMPAFFVISGFGTFYSLGRRTPGSFLGARARRLLVPLAFGIPVLALPQVYIQRVSHGEFTGSLWDFLPRFFDGWYGFGGNFAWMGLHLWYLLVLFVFSLICLPLFWRLRRPANAAEMGWWQKPGMLLLWALPLVLVELLVNLAPSSIGRRDFGGWSPAVYLLLFVQGFFLARDGRSRAGLLAGRWPALAAALLTTTALALIHFVPAVGAGLGEGARYALYGGLKPLASWAWVLVLLGFAARHLDFEHPLRRPLNEAVLPFYALHQTVIVVLAFLFLLDWAAPVALKFPLLLCGSFLVIVALYLGLIRPLKPLRWLFGMR